MKSFVILQRAFVSLLCDSPRVLESSRWSRSDTQRYKHTHTESETHTYTHTHTGRFTHFLFNGWHRSTCLVTYTEMIMSFLAICLSPTFLLVGNVAVKSRLAVTQPLTCLQTVQMKMFHNTIVIRRILSLSLLFTCRLFPFQKFVDASQNRCICFVLFGNYAHLRSSAQKKAKHNVKLFILEMKRIMAPLVH